MSRIKHRKPAPYSTFLDRKRHLDGGCGFDPLWMPGFLFDFQNACTTWALQKGRSALFADCGMGKTPMQLVWSENIVRKKQCTGRVLLLTPLAVGYQTLREAEKFNIEVSRSYRGEIGDAAITITNYERLHYFNTEDFDGIVCDESSILKNFDGKTKAAITTFARKVPFRLLCTATAAPNDYIELGTSSEALGVLGYIDMLQRFFKATGGSYAQGGSSRGAAARWNTDRFDGKWRFRGHAERDFWRWVCSWACALRKPSDLGFDDGAFTLPDLVLREHVVKTTTHTRGVLFDLPAVTLQQQRKERRRTLLERCEKAAELVNNTKQPAICWCYLNDEGDTLTTMIPDAEQIAGRDSDERKEEIFKAFTDGEVRVLVTKPTIAGFGLNWQHCAHQTFFPSHSFEQWYQAIRRSWRFGQTQPVTIDIITSEGERNVLLNMKRKQEAADKMFSQLIAFMNDENIVDADWNFKKEQENPTWL